MQRTHRTPFMKASLTAVGAIALVGSTFAGTAFAHDKGDAPGQAKKADTTEWQAQSTRGDHDGDADRSTSTHYTEDNDTNDGGTPNNVADAGDNRHPSGKDRSVEHGGSGTQGKSESDPDGLKNGGADKPNGPGGIDKADQDGNNGCGNDDDFEDDNNGNCGGKAHVKADHAKPAQGCTCSHPTTTTVKPAKAEHAKPAKAEHAKPEAKPAKAEHAKAEHGTTSCDRRNDERDQRAARAEHTKPAKPAKPVTPATPVTPAPTTTTTTVPVLVAPASVPSATCPTAAGSEAAMLAGCQPATPAPGEVLAAEATAPAPVGAAASATPPAPSGEVMAAEATAPAPAAVSPASSRSGNIVAAAASGALAFTGSNLLTLLVAALLAIAIGWFILRADRKRNA